MPAELLGRGLPDDPGPRGNPPVHQFIPAQAGIHPEIIPGHFSWLRQGHGRQVAGRGGNDPRNRPGAGQELDPLADGIAVSQAGSSLPVLAIRQPDKAVPIDSPNQVTEFVGVSNQKQLSSLAPDVGQQVTNAGAPGVSPKLSPECFDIIQDNSLLAYRPGEFGQFFNQLKHNPSLIS